MRSNNVPPGFQSAGRLPFNRTGGCTPLFLPRLLLEAHSEDLLLLTINLCSLFRGHCGQQPLDAVECAVRIVRREGFLVGPLVAYLTKFTHQAALGLAECFPEDIVPLVPHHAEQRVSVQAGFLGLLSGRGVGIEQTRARDPVLSVRRLKFPLDELPREPAPYPREVALA